MITAYALLLDRCGLSQREAAAFHGRARIDTIKSWSAGRNPAPDGAMAELRALYARIEMAAAETLALIKAQPGVDAVEIGLANNDAEAESLGWPCVGAHAALIGLVAARSPMRVQVVPRRSTAAVRAAARAHSR